MKTMKRLFPILAVLLTLAGCKSNEEKALELIEYDLERTLYDIESYSPIETGLTEAKEIAENDPICISKAIEIVKSVNKSSEEMENAQDAQRSMEIWGAPTSWSSSYSDQKFFQYREDCQEHMELAAKALDDAKKQYDELKERIQQLDTTKVIGWEVTHRFRCRTRGGDAAIADFRYIIDENFTQILHRDDLDDEHIPHRNEVIGYAKTGEDLFDMATQNLR